MTIPMNMAESRVNTYAWTRTTISSSAVMATASGTETASPTADAEHGVLHHFGEQKYERQHRQDADAPPVMLAASRMVG